MNIRFRDVTQVSIFLYRVNFCRQLLRFSTRYAILFSEHRKEAHRGNLYARYRRILHTGRGGSYSPNHGRLCYQTLKAKEDPWIQSRGLLEDQQGRVSRSSSQDEEHSRRPAINKAGLHRQMTIEKFTAVWLPLKQPEKLARDNPWCALPTFSITKVANQCNGYTRLWAHGRRCAHE